MTIGYKFGFGIDGAERRFEYPNVWSREDTTGSERLVIAPSNDHVSLIIDLSRSMAEPFGFLYVLTVPRGQAMAARYQSSKPVQRKEAEEFLARFRQFFECDGRHHIWIKSVATKDLLVFDKHNVVYAYGELPKFEEILIAHGVQQTDKVCFPSPHIHNYNSEFDEEEQELMRYWEWKQFPLQASDDL